MKTRRILALVICVVMIISMLPFAAIGASALNVTDKISEVELTIPEPKAGNTVNLSFSSVEVGNGMEYKVVGLTWYKNHETQKMGVESDADTYFIGGNSYTVRIDLEARTEDGWNIDEWRGHETDYSGISATLNGKTAEVTYRELNANLRTICVKYTFDNIPDGVVNYPGVVIPTPIAGSNPPSAEELKVTNPRALWIPETDYIWYTYENDSWRKMEDDETYVAGARYKVAFAMQTLPGFRFNLEDANDYRNDGGMHVWGYINGTQKTMVLHKIGEYQGVPQYSDQRVTAEYEFTSCEAQYVDSVEFGGITAPSATQHPQYNIPTMAGNFALYDDEEFTGGAEYNFVNGIQWSAVGGGILNEDSVFEEGGNYSMSFFIKTFDTHRFTEWVEASANIGYVDVFVMPDDSSVALVTISFAPCDGGVLSDINISGVKNPVHGEAPDYEFTYGQGYDLGTSADAIVWFDLTANKKLLSTDTFIYGHEYELRIILRSDKQIYGASTGKFEFASHDSLTVKANGIKATKIERYNNNPEASWVLAYIPFECEKHVIEQVVITVDNPAEGNNPAAKLEKGDDTYDIAEFMFVDADTDTAMKADDVFAGGKNYRFVLAVAPKEGFTFKEGITEALINGQYAGVIYAGDDGALISINLLSEEAPYYIVSFNAGMGTGSMSDIVVKSGIITLPECEFTVPDGKVFAGWSVDYGMNLLGREYVVTENVTLEAIYVNDGEHRHVYSDLYVSFDGIQHYKMCVDENCDDIGTSYIYENHSYGNNSNCEDTCTVCGYIRTQGLGGEKLHFYPYACSEVCPNCGLQRTTVHSPGEVSCTEDQTCTVCAKVLAEAPGHVAGDAATCTTAQVCTVCHAELAAALGHAEGDAATCTTAQTCTVCHAELAAALGHTKGDEATCTTAQVCTVCDAELEAALGHTEGAAATCTAAQICTVCDAELVAALGHTAGDEATCTTAQICTVCQAELVAALGHSAGIEWITDGEGHHKLCACGEKLEAGCHADENGDKACDACGYDMHTGLPGWAIALIVVGGALVLGGGAFCVYWFVIRKKEQEIQ